MKIYTKWMWTSLALVVLLGGPSCAAGDETTGELRQALLCQSVDVCNDNNPCTDDLCVANLCANLPLINCCIGCGGEAGAPGAAGAASASGGRAGSSGSATGGSASGHAPVGGTSQAGAATGEGGDQQAGSPIEGQGADANAVDGGSSTGAVGGDSSPLSGSSAGGSSGSASAALRLEGGGCTIATTGGTGGDAISLALLLGIAWRGRRSRRVALVASGLRS